MVGSLSDTLNSTARSSIPVSEFVATADAGDFGLALGRIAAKANGAPVILAPGKTYTVQTNQVVTNKDFHLVGAPKAKIIHGVTGTCLSVYGTFTNVQAVTVGSFTENAVTVANGAAYSPGDPVKIVSDTRKPGSRPAPGDGTDYRCGYSAIVLAVAGNVLTLDRWPPYDPATYFASNPRIAKYSTARFCIDGVEISAISGKESVSSWGNSLVTLFGLYAPAIDKFVSLRNYGPAISLAGTFRARVSDIRGDNFINDEANGRFGYVVNDAGEETLVSNAIFGRNRHGYTTNEVSIASNSNRFEYYGGVRGAVVSGVGSGLSQAHFDTHHGAENVTFLNPVSYNVGANDGFPDAGYGVVLRGRGHRVIAPVIDGAEIGVFIWSEDGVATGDYTADCEVLDAVVKNAKSDALKIIKAAATINGGSYSSESSRAVTYDTCTVIERGSITVTTEAVAAGTGSMIREENSSVDAFGSFKIIKSAASTGTGAGLFFVGTPTRKGGRMLFDLGAGYSSSVAKNAGVGGVLSDCEVTYSPATSFDPTLCVARVKSKKSDGSATSAFQTITLTADNWVLSIPGTDEDLFFRLFSTNPSSRSLGALPDGNRIGQRMVISFSTTTQAVLRIRPGGAYNTSLPFTVILRNEEAVELFWNGATWALSQPSRDDLVLALSDADATIKPSDAALCLLSDPLTANRTVTITKPFTTSDVLAVTREFSRSSASTGAFDLIIKSSSGTTLATLATGQWAKIFWSNVTNDFEAFSFGS